MQAERPQEAPCTSPPNTFSARSASFLTAIRTNQWSKPRQTFRNQRGEGAAAVARNNGRRAMQGATATLTAIGPTRSAPDREDCRRGVGLSPYNVVCGRRQPKRRRKRSPRQQPPYLLRQPHRGGAADSRSPRCDQATGPRRWRDSKDAQETRPARGRWPRAASFSELAGTASSSTGSMMAIANTPSLNAPRRCVRRRRGRAFIGISSLAMRQPIARQGSAGATPSPRPVGRAAAQPGVTRTCSAAQPRCRRSTGRWRRGRRAPCPCHGPADGIRNSSSNSSVRGCDTRTHSRRHGGDGDTRTADDRLRDRRSRLGRGDAGGRDLPCDSTRRARPHAVQRPRRGRALGPLCSSGAPSWRCRSL